MYQLGKFKTTKLETSHHIDVTKVGELVTMSLGDEKCTIESQNFTKSQTTYSKS